MNKLKKYLVKVTFYAGSDDPEDTDIGLCIIETELGLKAAKKAFTEIADKANALCVYYEEWLDDEEDESEEAPGEREISVSYEDGVNIYVLAQAISELKDKPFELLEVNTNEYVLCADNAEEYKGETDGFFSIKQWQ